MNKLQRITDYLSAHGLNQAATLDAWIEEGTFEPRAKNEGTGYTILTMAYKAIVSIERYAHSAHLLAAMVAIWMQEQGEEFDDSMVGFSADKTDDELFDIELEFMLSEDVQIVRDPNGPLTFMGEQYRIESAPVWVAEDFTLDADIAN
ncbi:phage tail protein [Pseudoalteromonas sp. CNC9-20]|uniref:phage tail protein n=1 Tax=Pseudoalteromonas TaxID=53246 RepID=UPI001EF4C511|nr:MULTISPECIES: phage tail protein [Pseudoalteromonas]MCG7570545.1 phage tail protein [Pseudoalteromonas sp. CNC9-20]|tara:strand:+ start:68640 stop:69083 length:444 start_codon:yes stop_codon:yes gene_type:complete